MKFKHNGLWASLLASAGLLVACGGGGIGSGGTGAAPSSGVASGTVNGFGSIFVGGVRCDDARAKVSYNTTSGGPETGTPDVKLGQHVEIVFDATSATCKVLTAMVDPDIVGVVGSVSPLTVAGQRVALNTDASVAPPTVIEGFSDLSDLKVGDRVEIHGQSIVSGGVTALQATRIERKPVTDQWVRVKGVVANLGAQQFQIGSLTVKTDGLTRLDPANLALANGGTVVVWSTAAMAGDGSITASAIRAVQRSLSDQQVVRVEGPVSGCGAVPCATPVIDGLSIDLSAAVFSSGSAADVGNGVAMRVEGSYDAAKSRLVATKASVRSRDAAAGDVTLIGMVSDFVSSSDFTVRGVPVSTGGGTTVAAGCTIAPGQIVGIQGRVSTATAGQVDATSVTCLTLSEGGTLDLFGGLLNVDTGAKTFNVTEGAYKSYTFVWDDDTVFAAGLSGATLSNGQRMGLRAVLVDGKLLVKRMIGDPVPTAPAGTQLYGNYGIAQDVSASSLTVNKIQMAVVPGTTTLGGSIVDGTQVRTWFYRADANAPWTALQVSPVAWN